jgi:hypothetical protein
MGSLRRYTPRDDVFIMININKIPRLDFVDMLRGLAIVVMILLHTNAYFLKNPISFFTWDWGQFAVPVFIFCSSYVFFQKQYVFASVEDFFQYIKKRIIRLLVPYYIFVVVYFGLIYFQNPAKLSTKYILQTLTLTGGIDINWLVLLFIYFIFIMPFIQLINKRKLLFVVYSLLSVIVSFLLIFNSNFLNLNYRYTMWLPWTLLIVANYFMVKYEKNKKVVFGIFSVNVFIFVILYFFQKYLGHSTVQYYNKYPPNLYHLAFCVWSTIVVYWIAKKGLFSFFPLKQILSFISINSYSLFFIHYCIIFFLTVFTKLRFNWVSFFSYVLILSIVVQLLINASILILLKISKPSQKQKELIK